MASTVLTHPKTIAILLGGTLFEDASRWVAGDRPAAASALDVADLNRRFENASTEEILEWVWKAWGPTVAASSSFQAQSVPLLHAISQVCPDMPVIFIDTGFHFRETLAFRDKVQARYGLNVKVVRPAIAENQLSRQYGKGLYQRDPDLCCYLHKVEPMQRALSEFRVWVTGIRQDQTAHRQSLNALELGPTGLLKVHPMINWTQRGIWEHIHEHKLPTHPLLSSGYLGVGCTPCTRPVVAGEGERAGRWAGTGKTECGLHKDWTYPAPAADRHIRLAKYRAQFANWLLGWAAAPGAHEQRHDNTDRHNQE